eukprot:COSAG01_NODE_8841_length_2640_cov_3.086974_3_plen_68_part_00
MRELVALTPKASASARPGTLLLPWCARPPRPCLVDAGLNAIWTVEPCLSMPPAWVGCGDVAVPAELP